MLNKYIWNREISVPYGKIPKNEYCETAIRRKQLWQER